MKITAKTAETNARLKDLRPGELFVAGISQGAQLEDGLFMKVEIPGLGHSGVVIEGSDPAPGFWALLLMTGEISVMPEDAWVRPVKEADLRVVL